MKKWIEPQPVTVPDELVAAVGGHRLVAETLVRRGITDVETAKAFLNPDLYSPAPPSDLPDMDRAVERVERAIRSKETICVWGDFDVDGQTATTLLVSALRGLGAEVTFHIPDRLIEGHGVHVATLKQFIDEGANLILTCDTGIAAHEAVNYARSRGVEVVVTDHHNLPPSLPDAYAVVNPKRLPETHPLHELPGVGVAYKLVEELYNRTRRGDECEQFLDLVALGIVADVAVVTGDTRYLLQRGLEVLRHTERLGLKAMMENAELNAEQISEEHIGFMLGPRLNALGRLDDANQAVELLTTDDLARARTLATHLEGLNNQRKVESEQIFQGVLKQIEGDSSLLDYAALVLANPAWKPGVIGIVAARLVERYNRPVVLIATPQGEVARGSARSVYGCDITAAIAAHQDLLVSFGGHTMAAGLSIQPENIPDFRRALSRTVRQMLGVVEFVPTLHIDGYLPLSELSLDLVGELERLAPFGPGNPPLTLASRGVEVKGHRVIGRAQEHVLATVEDESGNEQRVIWWQGDKDSLPQGRFDLAYVVRASDYQGRREVQVEWLDVRPVEGEASLWSLASIEVIDWRREPDAPGRLKRLRSECASLAVWAEGPEMEQVGGLHRGQLQPSEVLVVWTAPPGSAELQAALERVAPSKVYLYDADPGVHTLDAFLKRLGGLVKYALMEKGGKISVSELAALMAHREATVRKGIEWLAAHGDIEVLSENGDELIVAGGQRTPRADTAPIVKQLQVLLKETSAYRRHYRRADKDSLVAGERAS